MKIATWNVNSVRSRLERLLAWLRKVQPDVLCLQEIKVMDDKFPYEPVQEAGYRAAVYGQKTYSRRIEHSAHQWVSDLIVDNRVGYQILPSNWNIEGALPPLMRSICSPMAPPISMPPIKRVPYTKVCRMNAKASVASAK